MISYLHDGKVLIRFIADTAEPVEGSFRFNDVLQICPLPDDAPKPVRSIGTMDQHPFIIEYSFDEMDIETLRKVRTEGLSSSSYIPEDAFFVTDYYRSKQQEILSILSVITRNLVTTESPARHWVREGDNAIQPGRFSDSLHFFDGYSRLGTWFSTQDSLEISLVNSTTYYNQTGNAGGSFALSDATISLLETYFDLNDDEKRAFLSACVLFSKALEAKTVSVSLTYIGIVSSLEALIDFEHRGEKENRCKKCNQLKYKVRKKFCEFVAEYASTDIECKKFANNLYDRRSGIGHRGELLADDVVGRVVPPSAENQDWTELSNMIHLARICFVNWLEKRT